MSESLNGFDQWAILELLGHVKLAGRVTEEEHFGSKLGRIDIPMSGGSFTTQYFGGGSIYRITPTTEEIARAVALRNQPAPVHRWELPAPAGRTAPEHLEDTLDYSEQDIESEWERKAMEMGEDDEDDEEPRDFVAEMMARQEERISNKLSDDGPDT